MTSALRKWYPLLLTAVGVLMTLAVYPRLPETIAVHWDLDGNPNGWMPRAIGAFFAPVFLLLLWGLLRLAPRMDSREEHSRRFSEAYETIVASALLLVLATHGIVLAIALGHHVPVGRIVPALVGALFVVIGNVMPRTRANWWFGVRTPWTLSSDRVWERTHRLAGYSMTVAGVVMIVTGLVLPSTLGAPVMIAAAVGSVIAPAVYSYLTWRRESNGRAQ
ncbi:MAG TPA: SdpI family protein [Gemmatimonadaceae bacterium]|nr:SdpI family protein [Gemmatimonadaceae bacterium]